ncbi:hypothetical protein CDEST_13589 [Colletotrichum destructivum]|uniref:Uncharacterized protein n=1 Tax=Colletotrichum destructivum TaxID=34406 RepID=A0AAX4IZE9_9PEZI|nr:hypothetical protein CDEST_13589 [Colletotrichum destructivum]
MSTFFILRSRIAGRVTSRQTLWRLRLLRPQPSVQHVWLISPLFPFSQSLSLVTIIFLKRCCGGCFLHISPNVHGCVFPHQDGALTVVVELSFAGRVVVASTFTGVLQRSVRLLRSPSRLNISHLSNAPLPKRPSTGEPVTLRAEYPWESTRNSSTPHVLISKELTEHSVSSTSKRICRGRENQELYIHRSGRVGKASKQAAQCYEGQRARMLGGCCTRSITLRTILSRRRLTRCCCPT